MTTKRPCIRVLGPRSPLAVILALLFLLGPGSAYAQTRFPAAQVQTDQSGVSTPPDEPLPSWESVEGKHNFWRAATEVAAVNLLLWGYNRFIREGGTNPGFRINMDSWEENIKNGFEWDDNNFNTNQFAHPYHGSVYYNAARDNGYNYWQSIPFAFAGSLMWEYFMEKHHPSINDWYATSIGGVALGESLYRLSDLVLDNTDTGGSRTWRELGGLILNPARGFNRLFTGRSFKRYENPAARHPGMWATYFDAGLRTVGSNAFETDTTNVFAQFRFEYGNPYEEIKKPFDFFDFSFQLNFSDVSTLGRVQAHGALWGARMAESDDSEHTISVIQNFDYFNNRAFEYGGQSVGGGVFSRFRAGKSELRTLLQLNAILMGADQSDYPSISGRTYDYGPGVGFRFRAELHRKGRRFFDVGHEQSLIEVLNGNDGSHLITMSWGRLDVPVVGNLAVGAMYVLYLAERKYEDFPDVSARSPQARIYLSWLLGEIKE